MVVETSLNTNQTQIQAGMFADFPENPEREFRAAQADLLRRLALSELIDEEEMRVYGCWEGMEGAESPRGESPREEGGGEGRMGGWY